MKSRKNKRAWPERIRALLGAGETPDIHRLAQVLRVDQSLLLDWLMGRAKPSPKLARLILKLERSGSLRIARSYLRPWHARLQEGRKEPAPTVPTQGPLDYDRYLSLLHESARLSLSRWDFHERDEYRPRMMLPNFTRGAEESLANRKQSYRRSLDRIREVERRFPTEIAAFPLTQAAIREGLTPAEVRMAAYLMKEDGPTYEGPGSASGRALVQIACGPGGDLMDFRKLLAPDGRLRKSGILERRKHGGSFFGFSRNDSSSVLDGDYVLSSRARKELLGPLLERAVSEAKSDGISPATTPRFRLDAVVLPPDHRARASEFLVELRNRDLLYKEWGLAETVHYGRGMTMLFEGPPGTGKTMLAEALAGEAGLQFMTASFPKLVSMWVGETEKNIARLFREARESGAILFIDEADGLFGSRELAQHSWEVRDVNVLLKELEEFEGVCVLATNNTAILDRALESRLSLRLKFRMPDADARLEIWKKHIPTKMPLGGDVDLKALAGRYEISGRDIKQAVLTAARAAVARDGRAAVVTMADLERAAAERLTDGRTIGFGSRDAG